MRSTKLAMPLLLIIALSGCTMVTNEEWKRLQQDIGDLKREAQDTKKATEELKSQAGETQKSMESQLSLKITSTEKALSDTEKELRKKQADIVADMTSIRSDFQVLSGRFEETRYAIQKNVQEGKVSREEFDLWRKETSQILGDLQKRIASLEQSLLILRQEREVGKEKETKAPSFEDAYKDAYETYQKGDYAPAREKFQRYLEAYPNSKYTENSQYWIGECYYGEKEYEKAIVVFDDVVKKYPDGAKAPAALLKQGMAFSALGDKKSANAIFKQLIEKYPKSDQAEVAKKKLKE